jgi:hypothetical protein
MEALILALILTWALKHAWDHSRGEYRKSREAHRQKQPKTAKPKRSAELIHHDIGYWAHQGSHAFPVFRHGLGQGWHEARQKAARYRADRERAKTEHLETAADLEPQITDFRQRQAGARDRIREARQPGEGGGEGSPEVPPDEVPQQYGTPGAKPSYSYGLPTSPHAWPADDLEDAHYRARHMSTDGRAWDATEYPPGGGPGKTVATYRDGEEIQPTGTERTGWDAVADAARREYDKQETSATTQGEAPMPAADTTYDGVLSQMAAAKADAENRAAEQQRASQNASNTSEEMQALEVDSQTLSAMADHLDAHADATKAQNRVQETAEAVEAALKRGHKDLAEAHQNAPVEAAQKEFYSA